MKLIETYIKEVGRNLPKKNRLDIEEEIRSLINDTLADRSQAAGSEVDEALIVTVLKEFGPPEKVAASYLPEKNLIGPRLYPTFLLVLRIVLIVLGVISLIGIAIHVSRDPLTSQNILKNLGLGLSGFFNMSWQVLGILVFIFAILDRTLPDLGHEPEDWDPTKMEAIPEPDRVDILGIVWEMVFVTALIILLNFYPDKLGIWSLSSVKGWYFIPVFTKQFFRYTPLLTGIWVLEIVQNLILLRQGKWQLGTRILSIGIHALGIMVVVMMLVGPAIVEVSSQAVDFMKPLLDVAENLSHSTYGLYFFVRFILILILFVSAYEIFKTIIEMTGRKQVWSILAKKML